jgi:hypothetical protein
MFDLERVIRAPPVGAGGAPDRVRGPEEGDCGPVPGGFWKAHGFCGDQLVETLRRLGAEPPPGPADGVPAAGLRGLELFGSHLGDCPGPA